MITLYDHIQELRAELRGCHFTKRERAAVEAELAKALAEQAEIERNFDRAMEVYRRSGSDPQLTPEEARALLAPPEDDQPSGNCMMAIFADRIGGVPRSRQMRAIQCSVPSSRAGGLLTLNPHQRQLACHSPLCRTLGFSAPLRQKPRIIQGSNLRQEHAALYRCRPLPFPIPAPDPVARTKQHQSERGRLERPAEVEAAHELLNLPLRYYRHLAADLVDQSAFAFGGQTPCPVRCRRTGGFGSLPDGQQHRVERLFRRNA